MARYNPFRPNSIVTTGMFCGRMEELRSAEQSLFQTKNSNPKHFLISGERGIGKSSLLLCIDFTAKGELETLEKHKLNFIAIRKKQKKKKEKNKKNNILFFFFIL